MRLLLAVLTTALPIPHAALLSIDRSAGYRNYLPTRTLTGFTYAGWSHKRGVLRVGPRVPPHRDETAVRGDDLVDRVLVPRFGQVTQLLASRPRVATID